MPHFEKFFFYPDEIDTCTSKQYLTTRVRLFLTQNGHSIETNIDDCDYILLNTCGVTNAVENFFLKIIDDLLLHHKEKKIIVYGCLGRISSTLRAVSGLYQIINVKEEYKFDELFQNTISIQNIQGDFYNMNDEKQFIIHIGRGCIHNCSFCGTKKSIGHIKSVPVEEIKKTFLYALSKGCKDIRLGADDISSYGRDIGTDFAELLNELCSVEGDYQFALDYAEVSEFMKMYEKMKQSFHKVREMHLPVQSFSNRILKLMERKHTIEDYLLFLKTLRKNHSNLKVDSVIIYAYPTETFSEFLDNLKGALLFDRTSASIYSYREGTRSFSEAQVLPCEEVLKRANIILKMKQRYPQNYRISKMAKDGKYEVDGKKSLASELPFEKSDL